LETPNPKNHKAQILKHQMSKDEIKKKITTNNEKNSD
jgi:hypothetical protein